MAIVDNFTAADGTLLTALPNWATVYTDGGVPTVQSNALSAVGSNWSGGAGPRYTGRRTDGAFPNDQYAQITLSPAGNGVNLNGVSVRCAASANTYYYLYVGGSATTMYMGMFVAGVETSLGGAATLTPATNDLTRLDATGTTITPTQNGSSVGTPGAVTDAGIAGGYPGVALYYNGGPDGAADVFTCTDIISGPTINTQPATQYCATGATATFSTSATSSGGSLSYQWYNDGTTVGTNSASYTTGATTGADDGDEVYCAVTDSNGTTNTNSARLWLTDTSTGAGLKLKSSWFVDYRYRRFSHALEIAQPLLQFGLDNAAAQALWLDWIGFTGGSANPTIALAGQTITSAQGALSDGVSYALSGQSAVFSQGVFTYGVSYAPNGQTITLAQGVITANTAGNVTVGLAGQSAAFSEGAIGSAVAYGATGQSITSSHGSLLGGVSHGLSGQGITSAEGTLSSLLSYGLTAQSAIFVEGAVVAGWSATIALAGQTATFAEGSITPAVGTVIGLSGQTATLSQGALKDAIAYGITSQSITSAEGAPNRVVSYAIGAQAIVSAEGLIGTVISAGLTQITATFAVGSLKAQPSYAIGGQTASFLEGAITPQVAENVTVNLTGLTATFALGAIARSTGSSTDSELVLLSGADTLTVIIEDDFRAVTGDELFGAILKYDFARDGIADDESATIVIGDG